jgi:hypothetical protein
VEVVEVEAAEEVVGAVVVRQPPRRQAGQHRQQQAANKLPRSSPTTSPAGRFPCKWASK